MLLLCKLRVGRQSGCVCALQLKASPIAFSIHKKILEVITKSSLNKGS